MEHNYKYPEIMISTDGKSVEAKFIELPSGKILKRASAKCHENDKFKYGTGAAIALDRLFDGKIEIPEDKEEEKTTEDKPNSAESELEKDIETVMNFFADLFSF